MVKLSSERQSRLLNFGRLEILVLGRSEGKKKIEYPSVVTWLQFWQHEYFLNKQAMIGVMINK